MSQTDQSWYAAARTHDAGARTNTHAHTRTRGIKPDPQPRYAAAAPPLSHANDTGHTQRHENGHIRRNEAEARPRQHEGGRSPAARKRTGPGPAGATRRVLAAEGPGAGGAREKRGRKRRRGRAVATTGGLGTRFARRRTKPGLRALFLRLRVSRRRARTAHQSLPRAGTGAQANDTQARARAHTKARE